VSGNARFQRGTVPVRVVRRPPTADGLVAVTVAGDSETSGYKVAYRGELQAVIGALEAASKKLWEMRAAGTEPEVTP
jgi:hypothetical protein